MEIRFPTALNYSELKMDGALGESIPKAIATVISCNLVSGTTLAVELILEGIKFMSIIIITNQVLCVL